MRLLRVSCAGPHTDPSAALAGRAIGIDILEAGDAAEFLAEFVIWRAAEDVLAVVGVAPALEASIGDGLGDRPGRIWREAFQCHCGEWVAGL